MGADTRMKVVGEEGKRLCLIEVPELGRPHLLHAHQRGLARLRGGARRILDQQRMKGRAVAVLSHALPCQWQAVACRRVWLVCHCRSALVKMTPSARRSTGLTSPVV